MFSSFLITFRETLEATFVIGIILSLLVKTNQHAFKKYVGYGVLGGVIVSLFLGQIIQMFFGGLEGRSEQIFEGSLMFITTGFLTWMILWVHRQKEHIAHMKKKVTEHIGKGFGWGIALVTFVSIIREGIETVLYLKATSFSSGGNQLVGILSGMVIAVLVGYIIFRWALHHKITMVFKTTSVLLLLFAAGMVMHGVHEFQEAGILPLFAIDPLLNISKFLDHEEGFGSFLHALFGYTSKPTVLEIASYGVYVYVIFWLEKFTDKLIAKRHALSS